MSARQIIRPPRNGDYYKFACGCKRTPANTIPNGYWGSCKRCKAEYQRSRARTKAKAKPQPRTGPDFSRDPAVKLYREIKAERANRPNPAIDSAKRLYAEMLEQEKIARKGGRPPKGLQTEFRGRSYELAGRRAVG